MEDRSANGRLGRSDRGRARPPAWRLLMLTGAVLGGCGPIAALCAPAAIANTYHAASAAALEAAVKSADQDTGASTIELSSGNFLPTATLAIKREITIAGPASPPGAVLGGSGVAPFPSDLLDVETHAGLTLQNIEVTGGGGEATAAAIDDFGTVEIESSTLAGNPGTGLWVQPGASATVSDSTLSDGLAFGLVDDGSARLVNVTVASNHEGGIENRGTLSLTNTIVAGNRGSDCEGRATASDHSLDSDGSCGVGALSETDPRLGGLKDNGGPTLTQALEAGSPAIAAGDPSKCPNDDERHFIRPASSCDLGAYQAGAVPAGSTPQPGSGSGSGNHAAGALAVSAHGTLRGRRRSHITFTVRGIVGGRAATVRYRDGARHTAIVRLTSGSLAIDSRTGVATLRGVCVEANGRHARVTLVLVSHAGRRSLRISIAGGYHESGFLTGGSIAFT